VEEKMTAADQAPKIDELSTKAQSAVLLEEARILLQKGKLPESEAVFRKVIALSADAAEGLWTRCHSI
jgi:hypothetical protein